MGWAPWRTGSLQTRQTQTPLESACGSREGRRRRERARSVQRRAKCRLCASSCATLEREAIHALLGCGDCVQSRLWSTRGRCSGKKGEGRGGKGKRKGERRGEEGGEEGDKRGLEIGEMGVRSRERMGREMRVGGFDSAVHLEEKTRIGSAGFGESA